MLFILWFGARILKFESNVHTEADLEELKAAGVAVREVPGDIEAVMEVPGEDPRTHLSSSQHLEFSENVYK